MVFSARKLFVVLATVFPLAAMSADKLTAESAEKVYRNNCAVCHGDAGDGQSRARFGLDPQPRNFTTPQAAAELTRKRMLSSVMFGRKGTAMVAWKDRLSESEIEGVVDYIRGTFMQVAAAEPVETTPAPTKADPAQPEKAPSAEDAHMALGKRLYEENCRVCHGDRGNGATWTQTVLSPSPRNFTSPQSRRILTRKRMLASVTYGRKGTAMMSFSKRLNKDEIGAVVDYIRATFMTGPVVADAGMDMAQGGMPSHSTGGHGQAPESIGSHGMMPKAPEAAAQPEQVDMDAPFPNGLKGDFKQGRLFYMKSCVHCHGVRGDGNGRRASFINPKPRNFLHPQSRATLNRPTLFRAIVIGKPGTPMPAWGHVLTAQEVANVAEFVFQDFIQPDPSSIEQEETDVYELDKKKAQ